MVAHLTVARIAEGLGVAWNTAKMRCWLRASGSQSGIPAQGRPLLALAGRAHPAAADPATLRQHALLRTDSVRSIRALGG